MTDLIRPADFSDLPRLAELYDTARAFMRKTGNLLQWVNGYPSRGLLEADIAAGNLYVREADGVLCGVFAFIRGDDPTYARIDGSWLSDAPYGTIHRIASDGTHPAFFPQALRFCRAMEPHVRIDTHADNRVMQHVVTKHGFRFCGVIYLENGDPRLAYELLPDQP